MRVEQQNKILEAMQQKGEVEKKESSGIRFAETAAVKQSKSTDQKAIFVKDSTYLNPAKEEKKSIVEEIEEGAGMGQIGRIKWQCCPIRRPKRIMRKCRRKDFLWMLQPLIRL